jgi:hypothetical protein
VVHVPQATGQVEGISSCNLQRFGFFCTQAQSLFLALPSLFVKLKVFSESVQEASDAIGEADGDVVGLGAVLVGGDVCKSIDVRWN